LICDRLRRKSNKTAYQCNFKINITDLVLLALELKKFPAYENRNERIRQIGGSPGRSRITSDADLALNRHKTAVNPIDVSFQLKLSPLTTEIRKTTAGLQTEGKDEENDSSMFIPESPAIKAVGLESDKQSEAFLKVQEQTFQNILHENFKISASDSTQGEEKSHPECLHFVSDEENLFFTLEVVYSEKSLTKKKALNSYHSIFDKRLMNEFIVSKGKFKMLTIFRTPQRTIIK
jgi:hypothetical protein